MSKFIVTVLCLGLLLLSSCGQQLTKSKRAAIENAVFDVHKQLVAAAENRDADAMFEYILDSDETVIQIGDSVQTRREALESIRNSFQSFQEIRYEFTQKQLTILSPTKVEMTARGRSINTTPDGRVLTFPFTQISRFVLTDNGWKVQYAHHIPETI